MKIINSCFNCGYILEVPWTIREKINAILEVSWTICKKKNKSMYDILFGFIKQISSLLRLIVNVTKIINTIVNVTKIIHIFVF